MAIGDGTHTRAIDVKGPGPGSRYEASGSWSREVLYEKKTEVEKAR